MATYKKKAFNKDKNKASETESTTAEVFNTLDDTASKSEQWIERNSKPLFYGLVAIVVVVLSFLGYNKYIVEPQEIKASNEIAFPRKHFTQATKADTQVDSLYNLALEGADGNYGFLDIASEYKGTKAGNLANYYAGISYLQMKKHEEAITYLSAFSSDDEILGPTALGAIGDTFADINQLEDAFNYYEQAANKKNNEFTTPLFLFKAAQIAMELENYDNAVALFTQIKNKYSKSEQGKDIDKYINSAKYAGE
jgi:predicted negative regulator of RcsB-dependent stress response